MEILIGLCIAICIGIGLIWAWLDRILKELEKIYRKMK